MPKSLPLLHEAAYDDVEEELESYYEGNRLNKPKMFLSILARKDPAVQARELAEEKATRKPRKVLEPMYLARAHVTFASGALVWSPGASASLLFGTSNKIKIYSVFCEVLSCDDDVIITSTNEQFKYAFENQTLYYKNLPAKQCIAFISKGARDPEYRVFYNVVADNYSGLRKEYPEMTQDKIKEESKSEYTLLGLKYLVADKSMDLYAAITYKMAHDDLCQYEKNSDEQYRIPKVSKDKNVPDSTKLVDMILADLESKIICVDGSTVSFSVTPLESNAPKLSVRFSFVYTVQVPKKLQ